MALIHISKDPPKQTPVAFSHTSFFCNQAQNPFDFDVVVFHNYFQNCI